MISIGASLIFLCSCIGYFPNRTFPGMRGLILGSVYVSWSCDPAVFTFGCLVFFPPGRAVLIFFK